MNITTHLNVKKFALLARQNPMQAFEEFIAIKDTEEPDIVIAMGQEGLEKLTGQNPAYNTLAFSFLTHTMTIVERQLEFTGRHPDLTDSMNNLLDCAEILAETWRQTDKTRGMSVCAAIAGYKCKFDL